MTSISHVKMPRKTTSHTPIRPSFHVPGGSSGDCHAIVTQLHKIVNRMSGSKGLDSTRRIALLRGSSHGVRQKTDVSR